MTLSVVIVIASDTVRPASVDHLRHCLLALEEQQGGPALDIIVPHRPGVHGIDQLARRFPTVRFIELDDLKRSFPESREHHDELRARGLAVACGDVVALLEDHEIPESRWAAHVAAAHEQTDYAAIGGAVENSVDRALNWGVFFCDFGRYQNPVTPGRSAVASDVNVAYKRAPLEELASVWADGFNERVVHEVLLARGFRLALCPAMVVHQSRVGLTPSEAMTERFIWGRSYAATRAGRWGIVRRLMYGALSPLLPFLLLTRMTATAIGKRRRLREFVRASPWVAMLVTAWSFGELVGYLTVRAIPVPTRRHVVERA